MIGVFDSGFGGLTVLKSIMRRLPQYGYLYLGDSARAPYGPRSAQEVHAFTKAGVEFLFAQGAQLVVLACNTASSEALRKIQMEYLLQHSDRKVLGVLIPFAEAAAARTTNKRVGVLATEGTVTSGAFSREIKKLGDITVLQEAAPRLVPLIEAGKEHSPELADAVRHYVQPLLAEGIDTLVLGCTHYCLVDDAIRKAAGDAVHVISEEEVMPESLAKYLRRHPDIERRIERKDSVLFFTTGDVEPFERLGSHFFGSAIRAQKAELAL